MQKRICAIKSFKVDKLLINVYQNRLDMSQMAGEAVATKIKQLLTIQKKVSVIFASAFSQEEFLTALSVVPGIDWSKVVAFHMDEYIGLPKTHPQLFGNWLKRKIFNRVDPGKVHFINGNANPPGIEIKRYTNLLRDNPPDITCLGIGENGHIAFNDPAFADFNDPFFIKIVEPDATSRLQQVHDGCFKTFKEVPTRAFTLSIPALISAKWVYCMVPGPTKKAAVSRTVRGEISTGCPATILRRHKNAVLYLDADSASELN
ncbi:glucosamine-6-phosphate deaminase [Candidatus Atribacteria bacterium 1244-E10-H5-B2]|nr:MAG: glucosamine-6-phosphate deaminase [Candidatus Atribacteria bacterium 1244-E10-H5-B2]